ncbi:g847 [Coccomyxa elongata]
MGDVSDEEKKVLRLLGDPRSSKKMLIMLKEPQEEGEREKAEFAALAGTDIGTYNVKVPVKTPSHNIEYVITHLPQPLEYGIEPGKSGSAIFGIFTIDGNAQFAMRARLLTADLQESVPLPSMFGDDDTKYYWDEAADKMRGVRPTDAWGSTTNPAVRDRIFILEQDLLAVMDDKAAVKLLLSYLGALFEASDKYLKTDNDTDIFFRILERHRFPHIERQTKKRLWNISHSQLELIVQILARHIEGSSHITEPDRTALHSTLSTLSSFVTSVSSQAWSPAPLPNPDLAGPAQRLRSSVAEAMRSLGAYIGKRNPDSSSGPSDQGSPSTGQAPVYQPTSSDIDDVVRTGEAGTSTATSDHSEAGSEPAPIPPIVGTSDESAPSKRQAPSSLTPDAQEGAVIQTVEAGRGPAPIPSIIASSDHAGPEFQAPPGEDMDATNQVAEAGDPISAPLHVEGTIRPSPGQPSDVESEPTESGTSSKLTSLRALNYETPYLKRPLWKRELSGHQKGLDEMQAIPEAVELDATTPADVQSATVMPSTAVRETPASNLDKPLPPPPNIAPPLSDTVSQTTDKKPRAKSFLESVRSRLSPRPQSKPEQPVTKPAKGRGFSLFRRSKKSGGTQSPRRSRV